jgi:Leucine Rich repeat
MEHLTGVSARVIDAINNLRTDRGVVPTRRNLHLKAPINEREALLVVGFLHGVLSQESSSTATTTTTGLILEVDFEEDEEYPDEAMNVFCRFLESTTLPALHLSGFSTVQLRRLLNALHSNVSGVTELKISFSYEDQGPIGISELFRHKTNFTAISLDNCYDFDLAQILPFLRQGSAAHVLEKLEIDDCDIGDAGVRLLVNALVNSPTKYKNLYKLRLTWNEITADGIKYLSKLDADVLPSLTSLDLCFNRNILDDEVATKLFAQGMLLSPGTTLQKLYLAYCSLMPSSVTSASFK